MSVLEKVLSKTIDRLATKSKYQWTHQGSCNCGHIIQSATGMKPGEIHNIALTGPGEWKDHAKTYCESSGLPVDDLIKKILKTGIRIDEIAHLEWLTDPNIIRYIPSDKKPLCHKKKEDLIYYLETWRSILNVKRKSTIDHYEPLFVNGILYKPAFIPELILDENPSSGIAA